MIHTLPKILLLSDTPDWAFARECDALKQHLSHAYDFDLGYFYSNYKCSDYRGYKNIKDIDLRIYDLILIKGFLWFPTNRLKNVPPEKVVVSINSHHCFDREDCKPMMFDNADMYRHVFCISDSIFDRANEAFSNRHSIYFTPDGVDVDLFKNVRPERQKRFTIGWCGNAAHGSDHKRFYGLVVEVIRQSKKRKWDVKLAARGIDEKVMNEISGMDNVECREYSYNEMPEFYNSVDVVLNASQSESVCQPILESIACGRPVISTDTGYAKNLIVDGVNGFICKGQTGKFLDAIEVMQGKDYTKIFKLNEFISRNVIDWRLMVSYADIAFQKILKEIT